MLGSTESEEVRLISREIIFAEFQPITSQYLNVTDRKTDGWTDNLPWQYRDPLGCEVKIAMGLSTYTTGF